MSHEFFGYLICPYCKKEWHSVHELTEDDIIRCPECNEKFVYVEERNKKLKKYA